MSFQVRFPITVVSDDAVGTAVWSNPENAEADDSSNATAGVSAVSDTTTQYLKATGFGFDIPVDANISKVRVFFGRHTTGVGTVTDSAVRLVVGDVIGNEDGTVGTGSDTWSVNDPSQVDDYQFDGDSLTASEVNAADFGVALSALLAPTLVTNLTALVDYVQIQVVYESRIAKGMSGLSGATGRKC